MTKVVNENVITSDGWSISVARYEPDATPLGVIQILHAFGEHYGRYEEFAKYFCVNNYICVVHNQRGFGSIPKKLRGIVKDYDLLLDDMNLVRSRIDNWYPILPVFLFGHSMGGNIALSYVLKRSQDEYHKAIFETPWLSLSKEKSMPAFVIGISRIIGNANYKIAKTDNLNVNHLTRDSQVADEIKNDSYFHTRMSLKLFAQITDSGQYIINNISKLTLPTLFLIAAEDKIVSSKAIIDICNKNQANIRYIVIKDGYHSLHNDLCKNEVFEYMLDYLSKSMEVNINA